MALSPLTSVRLIRALHSNFPFMVCRVTPKLYIRLPHSQGKPTITQALSDQGTNRARAALYRTQRQLFAQPNRIIDYKMNPNGRILSVLFLEGMHTQIDPRKRICTYFLRSNGHTQHTSGTMKLSRTSSSSTGSSIYSFMVQGWLSEVEPNRSGCTRSGCMRSGCTRSDYLKLDCSLVSFNGMKFCRTRFTCARTCARYLKPRVDCTRVRSVRVHSS